MQFSIQISTFAHISTWFYVYRHLPLLKLTNLKYDHLTLLIQLCWAVSQKYRHLSLLEVSTLNLNAKKC